MPNPLMDIPAPPAPRKNPLLDIPAPRMERRSMDLLGAAKAGVQDIGRIGLALPALGEHLVGAGAEALGLTVPEDSTPASNTLGNMAATDAANAQMEQQNKTSPTIGTQLAEGGVRSAVGMAPSIALAPAAGANLSARGINLLSSVPGGLSTFGNSVGADMNDPTMGASQRLGRGVLQAGLEVAGENIPMGRLGLGPEEALARAIRGARVPGGAADIAGRVVGSGLAEMGQEGITGGLQAVADDLTDNETQSWSDIGSRALTEAGMSAATALPVSAGMSTATEGINALRIRQEQVQQQRVQAAQAIARAFDPTGAQATVDPTGAIVSKVQEQGPAPSEITPDVIQASQQDPTALDRLTPAELATLVNADQAEVADAVVPDAEGAGDAVRRAMEMADTTVLGERALRSADDEALRQQEIRQTIDNQIGTPRDTQAELDLAREQEALAAPKPVDVEQQNAQRTLADQERVQQENQAREQRRTAFRVREDIRAAEANNDVGTHAYDENGKLTVDSTRPNYFLSLPAEKRAKAIERARKFVRSNLGDDEGAMAADDPTATPEAAKYRMEQKPLPPEMASGVRTSTPTPEPTAQELTAMPPAQMREAFFKLPAESRQRIQPEITRIMQERKRQQEWEKGIRPFNAPQGAPTAVAAPQQQGTPNEKGQEGQGRQEGLLRQPAASAAPAPATGGAAEPVVPEMRQAPGGEVFEQIGNTRRIDSRITPKAANDAKQWKSAMPTFQGGKQKMAESTIAAIDSTMGQDAEKITEVHDLFGGGGSWGLFLTMTRFPNAKKLVVREYDADRLAKIKLFHEQGDRFMEIAQRSGALDIARADYEQVHRDQVAKGEADPNKVEASAGGLAGRIGRDLRAGSSLTPEQRAVLAAIRDYGYASFGRRSFDGIVSLVAEHAAGSKRAADAFRARGGAIEHQGGSSYDAQIPSGPGVLAVADPPYYGTASYNDYEGGSKVEAPLYANTAALMERLSKQNNSVVYTDEAWWSKRNKEGKPDAPADWQAGVPSLDRIQRSLDRFDIADKTIAGRYETLGIINGFRRTNESRTQRAEQQRAARTDDRGAAPVAGPEAGRPAVEPQPAGQRNDGARPVQPVAAGSQAEGAAAPAGRTAPVEAQPSKDLARIARIAKSVLPDNVKVEAKADHVAITYPGGATIQVRPVADVPLDPAAWFDSVAKVKGALSSAFSRAGFGATAPTKAQWLKLPKARQQAVMAELMPVAAVTDISGKRVGLSRDALVRLVQPGKRSDSEVADALEEEDHHFLFSALLTDRERAIIRDELGKANPALAKEDPASRAVMEAAYEHWRGWNQNRQRQITPRTQGIFRRLLARIKQLLGFADKVPMVAAKDAAAIWAQLGTVRERGAVTPSSTSEDGAANAVSRSGDPGIPPEPGISSDAWLSLTESQRIRLADRALLSGKQIASRNNVPLTNPVLRWVRVEDVTPSQTGDDYDNASSRSTAKSLRVMANSGEHPYGRIEDAAPVIIDDTGRIVDGNHRHAAATFNGDSYLLAWVGQSEAANAVVIPRDESLEPEAIQRQWRKATGAPKPKSSSWQSMVERADKVDEIRRLNQNDITDERETRNGVPYRRGNVDFTDPRVAYITSQDGWEKQYVPEAVLDRGDEEAMWRAAAKAQRERETAYAVPRLPDSEERIQPDADGVYRIKTYRGIKDTKKPNDHGVAGKGPYSSPKRSVAEMYAGKGGTVTEQIVELRNPLIASYDRLAEIQKKLYGKMLTGFERYESAQFDEWMREQGYDGAILFDDEVSKTEPGEVVKLADEPAYSTPQAINDVLPSDDRQTFAQWQQDADAILADEQRMADVRARALADAGLSPAEQVALRRLVAEQFSEAATSGNQNRWTEALETAALRKASGARVARELAARRLDLSTPEGRRELILNYATEMGSRWQSAYKRAKNARDRAAAAERWAKQQEKIRRVLKDRFGIDLTDPRLGEIFGDAYSVGQLMDTISDVGGGRFHLGRLVGYYVAGNLLSGAAFAANMTGYPLMMGIQTAKAMVPAITKLLMHSQRGNQELLSFQGASAAVRAGVGAMFRGLANGALAVWTGRPQANRKVDPTGGSEEDFNRMASPIKNPFLRVGVAPFLELNRFLDETAWTIGYSGALAAAAVEAKQAGDTRSHREIIDNPDQGMIEKAVRFADWFSLRGTGNKKADAALSQLSSLREASPQWLEKALPEDLQRFAVNPLYFVMPFFKTIAVLTMEGAKLAAPPVMAAVAAKRGIEALRADSTQDRQEAGAAALKATAYTLAGLALMGLAHIGGEDGEDDLVKGSPSNHKSAGEKALRFAVEKPRTIGGLDYSRLDPGALPLSLHADFRDAMREIQSGKDVGKVLGKLGDKAWNAAIQRQFLEGVSDLFTTQYNADGEPKSVPEKFRENVVGQLMPGRQYVSTYRRMTETERMERPKGEVARAYDPGRPARNLFGETEKTRDDTTKAAIAGLFFPPRGKASEEAQKWEKRIYDLNETIGESGGRTWWPNNPPRTYESKGQRIRYTDEQYDRLREISGKRWLALLNGSALLRAQTATVEKQLEVIQDLREKANQYAAGQVRRGSN